MDSSDVVKVLGNLDRRVARIEQYLPSLPTREEMQQGLHEAVAPLATRGEMQVAIAPLATRGEMQAAIAPLATREEMQAAIAPLATREEMQAAIAPLATREEMQAAIAPLAKREEMHAAIREEGQRTRRHFDVVAEGLRDDIRLIAEGHIDLISRMDARHGELAQADARLDVRVTRLETEPRKRR